MHRDLAPHAPERRERSQTYDVVEMQMAEKKRRIALLNGGHGLPEPRNPEPASTMIRLPAILISKHVVSPPKRS